MKAYGKGLEFTVELSKEEIESLSKNDLSGEIKLSDYQDGTRTIPFSLSTKSKEEMKEKIYFDGIFVESLPENSYLPQASRIGLYIGREAYNSLVEKRLYVTRFNTGGKVKICDREHREY